jgi:nucleotide-binding universal stress UspA family protein
MPPQTGTAPLFTAILCPVDFSANSRAALSYAARLARGSNCRLVVLYVDDPLLAVAAARRYDARTIIRDEERDLRRFVAQVVGTTEIPPVTLVTVAGKPAKEIVKTAERHRCDLIVMGYRGIGKASRLFFGSTTEGVVRSTSVPVLAIPPAGRRAKRSPAGSRAAGARRVSQK